MRIVELVPSLGVGGAERIVALLALALHDAGHAVSVVSLGAAQGSWIEAELRERGVDVHFLGKGAGFEPRVMARLARTLRRLRPEAIHTHLHVLKYLAPALVGLGPRRVVHTLHNLADKEATPADQRLQRALFRAGVEPVAIGDAVADSAARVYGRRPDACIPNGVPVDAFQRPSEVGARVRADLGIAATAPVFAVVGRLNPQKNHALLIEAFADPALARAGAHLLVVGDGELRADVEAQIEGLELGPRVHLLGVRRDVPDLLAAADAFVLSSDYEGNPLVVMEALAAGRAVVATAVGCVPELVGPDTGRLVPAGDAPALAAALRELAEDRALAATLGENGAAVARARFDVSVMAQAYLALFVADSRPAFPSLRR